jgi:RimJ/RimL family protein N-acetyltransferase
VTFSPTSAVRVEPARLDWLEALAESDDTFTTRFGIPAVTGWIGFPESLAYAIDGARATPEDPWGSHLFFDGNDGALVGFGGYKGPPIDGEVEVGYAIAPERQGRGLATAVVAIMVERARAAGVTLVSAHTLAEENASVAVLRKSGFTRTTEILDPDEGAIWRWELPTAG